VAIRFARRRHFLHRTSRQERRRGPDHRVGGDDFAPESGGATRLCGAAPARRCPAAVTQRETHVVADKARQALAGHGSMMVCLRHFMSGN